MNNYTLKTYNDILIKISMEKLYFHSKRKRKLTFIIYLIKEKTQ